MYNRFYNENENLRTLRSCLQCKRSNIYKI